MHVALFDLVCYAVFYDGDLRISLWVTALGFFMGLPVSFAVAQSRVLVAILTPLVFLLDGVAAYFVYYYRIDIRAGTLARKVYGRDAIHERHRHRFEFNNNYLERMQEAIGPWTFWVGVIKAPFFAFLIAMIGTLRGLHVRSSSRELGRLTTVAVVQSIFLVILADALFAVLFMELDI